MSFCVYGDKTCNLGDFGWLLACAVCEMRCNCVILNLVILTRSGRIQRSSLKRLNFVYSVI